MRVLWLEPGSYAIQSPGLSTVIVFDRFAPQDHEFLAARVLVRDGGGAGLHPDQVGAAAGRRIVDRGA